MNRNSPTAPERARLPNRRRVIPETLVVAGQEIEASVGFDPAIGRSRELFLTGAKDGTDLAAILRRQRRHCAGIPRRAGRAQGMRARNSGDHETALNILRPLAEQGDADAQVELGDMYSVGSVVPLDYVEAVKWFRKAADQGYANAWVHIYWHYRKII